MTALRKLAIGFPVYDKPEHDTVRCLRRLDVPSDTEYIETNGVVIDEARNNIVEKALAGNASHLLFVDADMTFPANAFTRLLRHDLAVVGGLYFNRRPPFAPLLMKTNHPSWFAEETLFGHVYDYPKDTIMEVDATGCGFLLVETDVFRKIGTYGWFDRIPQISEDFSFCVRANEQKVPVHVDTGLTLGHLAKVVITEGFAQRFHAKKDHLPWRSGPK